MTPQEFPNWLEYTDLNDLHHELISVAKYVLHSWLYPECEVPEDIILKACVKYGFSVDDLKPDAKLVELAKICEKHYYNVYYFLAKDVDVGVVENFFFFSNLCQHCSKKNNDFEHVIWDLKWMLSDIPFRWYHFKMSKKYARWQEERMPMWMKLYGSEIW